MPPVVPAAVHTEARSNRTRALLLLFLSILCLAVSPLLIRAVKDSFLVSFQNLFRFSLACCLLWACAAGRAEPAGLRALIRKIPAFWPKLTVLALVIYLHQTFFLAAVYRIYPGIANLLLQTTVLFSTFLALAFLPEERGLIRNTAFQLSLLAALAGVVLTITGGFQPGGGAFGPGAVLVLLSALCWSVYSVAVKRLFVSLPASLTTSLVFTLVVPMFLLSHLCVCGGDFFPRADPAGWLILALSGLVGGGGYLFYYSSLPVLGVTTAASLSLLIPLVTGLLSFLVFGEILAPTQLTGGAVLIAGCAVLIRIRLRDA